MFFILRHSSWPTPCGGSPCPRLVLPIPSSPLFPTTQAALTPSSSATSSRPGTPEQYVPTFSVALALAHTSGHVGDVFIQSESGSMGLQQMEIASTSQTMFCLNLKWVELFFSCSCWSWFHSALFRQFYSSEKKKSSHHLKTLWLIYLSFSFFPTWLHPVCIRLSSWTCCCAVASSSLT